MKRTFLPGLVGATILSLGVITAHSTLPASAQSSTTSDQNQVADNNDSPDLGWLGLLGLIGLAGLRRRHDNTPVRPRTSEDVDATTRRY